MNTLERLCGPLLLHTRFLEDLRLCLTLQRWPHLHATAHELIDVVMQPLLFLVLVFWDLFLDCQALMRDVAHDPILVLELLELYAPMLGQYLVPLFRSHLNLLLLPHCVLFSQPIQMVLPFIILIVGGTVSSIYSPPSQIPPLASLYSLWTYSSP